MPGSVAPLSGPITWTMPWRRSRNGKYAFAPIARMLASSVSTCVREIGSRMPSCPVLRRRVVVGGRDDRLDAPRLAAGEPQALVRLRARHLVHEVAVDVEQRRAVAFGADDVAVEELVVERAARDIGRACMRKAAISAARDAILARCVACPTCALAPEVASVPVASSARRSASSQAGASRGFRLASTPRSRVAQVRRAGRRSRAAGLALASREPASTVARRHARSTRRCRMLRMMRMPHAVVDDATLRRHAVARERAAALRTSCARCWRRRQTSCRASTGAGADVERAARRRRSLPALLRQRRGARRPRACASCRGNAARRRRLAHEARTRGEPRSR